MIKFEKILCLTTVVAFLLGSVVAEDEIKPLYDTQSFQVFNLTEDYVESNQQYIWKNIDDDPEIITLLSNKTVIELSNMDGIKNEHSSTEDFPVSASFEFWSKKSLRNVTNLSNKKITDTNEYFELHSQLSLDNVDITDWTTESLLQFRIGIHITRT